MSWTPEQEVSPPPIYPSIQRNYSGWILLSGLVLLMFAIAFDNYFSAGSPDKLAFNACDDALREAVQASPKAQKIKWQKFDLEVERHYQGKDGQRLALFRMVGAFERKKPVSPYDLNVLRYGSLEKRDMVLQVYERKTLTPREAKKLDKDFGSSAFVYRLAGIHALEKADDRSARSNLKSDLLEPSKRLSNVFGMLMFFASMAGLIVIGLYIGLRSIGKLEPLGHPLDGIDLEGADRCAMRAAQIMVVFIGLGILQWSSLLGEIPQSTANLVHELLILLFVVGLSRFRVLGGLITYANLGITMGKWKEHVIWGVAAAVANIPIFFVSVLVSEQLFSGLPQVRHAIVSELQNAPDIMMIVSLFISASVCAPIIEETLFRGTALPAVARIFKSKVGAIVLTSLCFAMFHGTGIPSWIPIGSIGLMAALVTYQTRSILPAMVFHAVHNGCVLLMSVFFPNL